MIDRPQKLKDLRTKIKDAEGGTWLLLLHIIGRTSAAMKNTLNYFLEEYFFKPSAIVVSYSPGIYGGAKCRIGTQIGFCRTGSSFNSLSLYHFKSHEHLF